MSKSIDEIHGFLDSEIDNSVKQPELHVKPSVRRRNVGLHSISMYVGGFTVAFLLGSVLMLPLFDNRSGLEIIGSWLSDVDNSDLVAMGDEKDGNGSLEPFIYTEFVKPVDSFGIENTTFVDVNWSFWTNWVNESVVSWLEKSKDGKAGWSDCSKLLVVKKDWDQENISVKYTFKWTSDEDMFYRVSYKLKEGSGLSSHYDEAAKQEDSNRYLLNCSITATENYECFWNWSDYKSSAEYSKSSFTKQVKVNSVSNKLEFFWSVVTDGIVKKGESFEVDPTFGNTGEDALSESTGNRIVGSKFTMGAVGGTADNITAYLKQNSNGNPTEIKFIIYDTSMNKVGETNAMDISSYTPAWYTLNIDGTVTLTANTDYWLCGWGELIWPPVVYTRYIAEACDWFKDTSVTYTVSNPTAPATATKDYTNANKHTSIYCSYTISAANNAPTFAGASPVNESTGITITPNIYIIPSDSDSDTMTCDWYTSTDGSSWTWRQTNNTVSSGTNISYSYSQASGYNTKYYWKVTANDGTDNTTSEFYEFTTETQTLTWHTVSNTIGDGVWTNTTTWSTISDSIGDGIWSNTTNWHTVSDSIGDGIWSNTTSWQTISSTIGNGIWSNTTSWQTISNTIGDGVWSNTTVWNTISNTIGDGVWSNGTVWHTVSNTIGDGIWSNGTTWQTISNTIGDGVWSNASIWYTISDSIGDGVWTNTTTTWHTISNTIGDGVWTNTSVTLITITSEYPSNESSNIPLQPTAYVTVNSTTGLTMNVSWYYGTDESNVNTLVGTDDLVINGTFTELYYPITGRTTTYYWRVMVNDGTNWVNETFTFTTEGYGGAGQIQSRGLIIAAMFIGMLALVIGFYVLNEKKKMEGE